MGLNWHKLIGRADRKGRPGAPSKKSEMLEIRLSLPLKEALTEHCKSTGVSRSAFVRAAISDRIERERRALSSWTVPAGEVAALVRSRAGVIGGAGCILIMSFVPALAMRPDASAMISMLELRELATEGPVVAHASAPPNVINLPLPDTPSVPAYN